MILNPAGEMINQWWQKIPSKFSIAQIHAFITMPDHFHGIISLVDMDGHVTNMDDHGGSDGHVLNMDGHGTNMDDHGTNMDGHVLNMDGHVTNMDGHGTNMDDHVLNMDGHVTNMDGHGTNMDGHVLNMDGHVTNMDGHGTNMDDHGINMDGHVTNMDDHRGSSLQEIVGWFKTMTTNAYIRNVKTNGWRRFDGKLWQRSYYDRIIRNQNQYNTIQKYIINNPANHK
jgi:REP element-mobilizing transposase RayT